MQRLKLLKWQLQPFVYNTFCGYLRIIEIAA